MLFLNEWEPDLTIRPSIYLKGVFYLVSLFVILSILFFTYYLVSTTSLKWVWIFLLLMWVSISVAMMLLIWRLDIALTHKRSITGLRFYDLPQPSWQLQLNSGEKICDLQIHHYFLSSYMIILLFEPPNLQKPSKPIFNTDKNSVHKKLQHVFGSNSRVAGRLFNVFSLCGGRQHCMILPDQVGEQCFRNLYLGLSLRKTNWLAMTG